MAQWLGSWTFTAGGWVTGSITACVSANFHTKTHTVRSWLGAVWGLGVLNLNFFKLGLWNYLFWGSLFGSMVWVVEFNAGGWVPHPGSQVWYQPVSVQIFTHKKTHKHTHIIHARTQAHTNNFYMFCLLIFVMSILVVLYTFYITYRRFI